MLTQHCNFLLQEVGHYYIEDDIMVLKAVSLTHASSI